MTKYTYDRQHAAHYLNGAVIVPDQIAENPAAWDESGESFPAIRANAFGNPLPGAPRKVRVRLDGAAYGLGTSGVGDMVVKPAGRLRSGATANWFPWAGPAVPVYICWMDRRNAMVRVLADTECDGAGYVAGQYYSPVPRAQLSPAVR